jgi:hypothetical protein
VLQGLDCRVHGVGSEACDAEQRVVDARTCSGWPLLPAVECFGSRV